MTISQELSSPLVVVVGATGVQGGSVIKALTESDKPYRFRGLTRDPSKPAARKLADEGVEIVEVSISSDTFDNVHKAFEGGNYIFAMTNFWEHMVKEREINEGILMIDAAKTAKVDLFIWSGLMPVNSFTGGKYTHVDHWDGKAAVTDYGRLSGVPFVDVQAGMYASNFSTASALAPRKENDGTYELALPAGPDMLIPVIDMVSDYGLFVREAIESPSFGAGSEVLTCGELIPVGEMMKQLSEITGKKIAFRQISDEEYVASLPEMMSERVKVEILESLKHTYHYGYYNGKSVIPSQQQLARKPHTWADYANATDWTNVLA